MPTEDQIRDALRVVIDPELRHNIVELGMVRSIRQPVHGRVEVVASLTTPGCPIRSPSEAVVDAVGALDGVARSDSASTSSPADEKQASSSAWPPGRAAERRLALVKNVICVGLGKGGVGKSTLTANLAAALVAEGRPAAAMDADVWGYSIPRMLNVHGKPRVNERRKIVPLPGAGGVQTISIEFFLERQDQAIVWRGPMLHKAIRQFLEDVEWGELDYLLIDLPPGTAKCRCARQLITHRAYGRHDAAEARRTSQARGGDRERLENGDSRVLRTDAFTSPGGNA